MVITIVLCLTFNATQCQALQRIVQQSPTEPLRPCLYAGGVPSMGDNLGRFIAGVRCDDGASLEWASAGISGFGVVAP
jgi:hypothetical protein